MAPTDVEQAIRDQAPDIAQQIRSAAEAHPGDEANFRRKVERLVEDFADAAGVQHDPRHEYTLFNGRADSVYNRLVVEYEPPASIHRSNTYRSNKHAIDQVKGYIEGLSRRERHKKERVAGVVLDGHWLIFVRHKDQRWEIDDPVPVATESTERFLRYLNSLSTELAVTPENLIRDFGENTRVSRPCVSRLYQALVETDNPRVEVLFRQWSMQFSEICGYEPGSARLDVQKVADSYGVRGRNIDPFRLFFAIHTYYATFIKLLAVQIASFYAFPKLGTGLQQVANYDTHRLHDYLLKMERGGVFKDFGISNFLEGDFFLWYLDVWNDEMDDAVRRMVSQLSGYSLVTLDVDPDNTRDLLKRLYQNLMPKALRHDLGEYYTPDWLAERLLNQLGYTEKTKDLPRKRILDPACGSGTFLVLAIKRIRQWAAAQKTPVNEADLLERILSNVVGFDLNPLAVISARTNYLLALGDLLQHRRGDISIPVYLADSILTPGMAADANGQLLMGETAGAALSFNTSVGRFSVPQTLVTAQYIDQPADLLEECVAARYPEDAFRSRLLTTFPLDETKDAAAIDVACGLYHRLVELEGEGINGIWARIIKNAFAPLFCAQFDYVAGNPPWVNWASLPTDYRESTKPLWQRYGLFTLSGWQARLGGGKKDLSALMTYAAADQYLRDGGTLGFVITQPLLKTKGAAAGFRRFQIGEDDYLKVIAVDDMVQLQPFEGASNRTAVLVLRKGVRTSYPVPYTIWRKPSKGRGIGAHLTLAEVQAETRRSKWVGVPVSQDEPTSPWLTGRRQAVSAVVKVVGDSGYQARSGCCTWANAVFWVRIVGTRPDDQFVIANADDEGRLEVGPVQAPVERELVLPLVRGRDVDRWSSSSSLHILMTQDPQTRSGIPEATLSMSYPRCYAYLKGFEALLRNRSGYRKYFGDQDAFYSVYNVGPYTFADHRVGWAREDTGLHVAVLTPGTVPDQTVQFVAVDSEDEAHYLCAALNSSPANFVAVSYSTDITTNITKVIGVPRYSPRYAEHNGLVALSREAHEIALRGEAATAEPSGLAEIGAEIDRLAAQLWGLTDKELKDIQDSLADLQS